MSRNTTYQAAPFVIPEVTDDDNDLTHQRDPERHRRERTVLEPAPDIPEGEVGEYLLSRDGWPGHNDNNGAQHLRKGQSRADVETRKSLEKDHPQTDTLDSIEYSWPESQGNTDPRSSTSCPRNVQSDGRHTPDHLGKCM